MVTEVAQGDAQGDGNDTGDAEPAIDMVDALANVRPTLVSLSDVAPTRRFNDILIGDHGFVTQTTGTLRILTTGNVTRVETRNPNEGASDELRGSEHHDGERTRLELHRGVLAPLAARLQA